MYIQCTNNTQITTNAVLSITTKETWWVWSLVCISIKLHQLKNTHLKDNGFKLCVQKTSK